MILKKPIIQYFIITMVLLCFGVNNTFATKPFTRLINGETWLDTNGQPINAHGGGILFHKGKYYWFGEIKTGKTWRVQGQKWECYRTNVGGVSCYSSKNLKDWKFEKIALSPNMTDSTSDLHFSRVLERPKVIYNQKIRKFVMWLHVDSEDYSYARAGVAVSNLPEGPYEYIKSFRPNENMSRDMTLFKDADEKAYLIYSSENNATMHICMLSDDYLQPTTTYKRVFINQFREAPAVFKLKNRYYMISSGCTGWAANKAMLAVSDSMLGDWKMRYNPCKGEKSEITFGAQSTYILPLCKKKNQFVFMADKWNKTDLPNSKYLWLPIVIKNDSIHIPWQNNFTTK